MSPVPRLASVILLAVSVAAPPCTARQTGEDTSLPPAGFGTLRQDDVAIRVDAGDIQLRVMPLDELILRLLAPDSYSALHALREANSADIAEIAQRNGAAEPGVFLVTVFASVEQAQFEPEQLTIVSRNRLFRPAGILPMSPLWNQRRLAQREVATAVYVFDDGIAVLEPFTVDYAGVRTDQWGRALQRIERERARIAARIRLEPEPH